MSDTVHIRTWKSIELAQWYKLVEWSELQLMCYAICLLYDHNFREVDKVQDRDEYWFDMLLLNTRDQVQ